VRNPIARFSLVEQRKRIGFVDLVEILDEVAAGTTMFTIDIMYPLRKV
jgi:hypothetical protein